MEASKQNNSTLFFSLHISARSCPRVSAPSLAVRPDPACLRALAGLKSHHNHTALFNEAFAGAFQLHPLQVHATVPVTVTPGLLFSPCRSLSVRGEKDACKIMRGERSAPTKQANTPPNASAPAELPASPCSIPVLSLHPCPVPGTCSDTSQSQLINRAKNWAHQLSPIPPSSRICPQSGQITMAKSVQLGERRGRGQQRSRISSFPRQPPPKSS